MMCGSWFVFRLVLLASFLPQYMQVPRPTQRKQTRADAKGRIYSETFSVRRVAVQRVGANGLVRGGVDGKERVKQGAITNVQDRIDG